MKPIAGGSPRGTPPKGAPAAPPTAVPLLAPVARAESARDCPGPRDDPFQRSAQAVRTHTVLSAT